MSSALLPARIAQVALIPNPTDFCFLLLLCPDSLRPFALLSLLVGNEILRILAANVCVDDQPFPVV